MIHFPFTMRGLILGFLICIGQGTFAQVNDVPNVPREAQEVIVAAEETIARDKITIDSRSERIKMLREQLEVTKEALELAVENNELSTEVRGNYEKRIELLLKKIEEEEKEAKKQKRRKTFWKSVAALEVGVIAYLLVF